MKRVGMAILYLVLAFISVLALFPIIYVTVCSFKSNREILLGGGNLLPETWIFTNYLEAWQKANFSLYTFNSIYYSGVATAIVLILTSMLGYCLNRGEFAGKKLITVLYISTLFMAGGATTLYPIFELCVKLGLSKSLNGLIIASVSGLQVMGTFLVIGYLQSIPREIDEAAVIDGCSFFRIYWNIIFPLLKPILATIAILTFQATWNSYMLPLAFTISNEDLRTLTVGVVALKSEVDGSAAWNLITTGATIALIPIIVVFLIMNKQIISGISTGAVKG